MSSTQQEQLSQLQAGLAQLGIPTATPAVLYPGPERNTIIDLLLKRLLPAALVDVLQQSVHDADLPVGLSAEEAQAHRFVRVLQAVDIHTSADQVRGCTSPDSSLRLLTTLTNLTTAHQRNTSDATAAAAAAAVAAATEASAVGSAPSPRPSPGPTPSYAPSPTPRQRTPGRAGGGGGGQDGGGGGSGRPLLLGLQSLDCELRLLDGLAERLPQVLEPGGGGNWFPADMMAALQPYLLNLGQPMSDVAAALERRAVGLRAALPLLRAEEARLAAEVSVVSDADWQRYAEATRAELATMLQTSSAFYRTFETGLGVWCAASTAADTCGLGPMASELLRRYDTVQRLGAGLAQIRQAHGSITSCAPPLTLLESQSLSQLVRLGQAAVEQLRGRIAMEQRVLAAAAPEADSRAAAALRAAAGVAVM